MSRRFFLFLFLFSVPWLPISPFLVHLAPLYNWRIRLELIRSCGSLKTRVYSRALCENCGQSETTSTTNQPRYSIQSLTMVSIHKSIHKSIHIKPMVYKSILYIYMRVVEEGILIKGQGELPLSRSPPSFFFFLYI